MKLGVIMFIKKFNNQAESIEQSQRLYQLEGFTTTNDLLWGNDVFYWGKKDYPLGDFQTLKDAVQRIINLSSIASKADSDMILFSGTSSSLFDSFNQWKAGTIVDLKGFTSTSRNISIANEFANDVIFVINNPKNNPIIPLENDIRNEQEVLLPPTSYEIEHFEIKDSKTILIYLKPTQLLNVQKLTISGLEQIKTKLNKDSQFNSKDVDKLIKKVNKEFNSIGYTSSPFESELN